IGTTLPPSTVCSKNFALHPPCASTEHSPSRAPMVHELGSRFSTIAAPSTPARTRTCTWCEERCSESWAGWTRLARACEKPSGLPATQQKQHRSPISSGASRQAHEGFAAPVGASALVGASAPVGASALVGALGLGG